MTNRKIKELISQYPTSNDQSVILRIPSVTPIFTWIMLFLLASIAGVRLIFINESASVIGASLGIQGDAVLYHLQAYRLVTAQVLLPQKVAFLSLLHTLVGLYLLYIVGISAERLWGHLRLILLYVLGGLTGVSATLVSINFQILPSDIYFVSACAGLMGVLSGEFVYLYNHRKLYRLRAVKRIYYLTAIGILYFLLSVFVKDVDVGGMLAALIGGRDIIFPNYSSPYPTSSSRSRRCFVW